MPAANVIDIEAFRSPPVHVERWPHPDRPHCICFCVTGHRSADVQAFITSLDAEIDNHGAGFASFNGPYRRKGRYEARGFVEFFREVP